MDVNLGFGLEQLEIALKRHGQSGTVERVISMEAESALPKGENYASTIYRITLRVVLGNGRTAKRSLILKVVPQEEAKAKLMTTMGIFKIETMMYVTVLSEMAALMEEFGDTSDVLWCRLLHYEPYSSLLLEDLKASGFRMTRRQDCLDLEHSLLVLRSLGRFHAMSKILEQRGIISRDDYKPYFLLNDTNLIKYIIHYGLQTLAKAMEEHWGPEWYDAAQKIKVPCEVLEEKMMELGKIDESKFNCLNHGDCWSNNMLFKYDWQNRPYTMRFLDYQIVHYNSVAIDLSYFIYGNVSSTVRLQKMNQLLDAYHESLNSTLDFFGYEGVKLSRDSLTEDMERAFPIQVFSIIFITYVRASDDPDNFNLEEILKSEGVRGIDQKGFTGLFKTKIEGEMEWLVNEIEKKFSKPGK